LGISIVGGKVDHPSAEGSSKDSSSAPSPGGFATPIQSLKIGSQSGFISGIFIKHVLDNSPAGANGTLKTGDRILAVNDIDLAHATHDRAVDVIRNASSPVKFYIQSLICAGTGNNNGSTINSATGRHFMLILINSIT
jgi:C-terminal processing protease CtpA/Prc